MLTLFVGITMILIYGLTCYYIGFNTWRWLSKTFSFRFKKTFIVVVFLLAISFFVGFAIHLPVIEWIGGYWLVIVGYGILLLPIINLLYFISKKNAKFFTYSGWAIVAFFTFVFVYGTYNAWTPIVRDYQITIDQPTEAKEGKLKVLLAADLHLGTIIGNNHLEKLVKIANQEKPDIILIPGDIINDDITPYVEQEMNKAMAKLEAPLGVFASPGNHDYYGGDNEQLKKELNDIGIHYLMDEAEIVNDQFVVIGREDLTNPNRKTIEELIATNKTKDLPVIVLDHQPHEITEAQVAGADVILSGHTHRGQLFPANLITAKLFENDWGYMQKEQLHSFTTSGFGLWGPTLRIGSQSEVMIIEIDFR
ncbi:metallophosphoesterase [Cytobacillus kochii]|uniref:metallophosphoesterase n=1 Tax=Cytobacillus kochii TaxID=859143 RepID=UPI00402A7968